MEINIMMVTLLLWTLMQRGGTSTPVERVVVAGSSVELRCDIPYDRSKDFHWVESNYGGILRRLANKPPDEFQLFHPGFRDRVSLEGPDGVDLRIENVKKEDEGSYNCQEEGAERDGTLQKLLVADALPSSGLSDGEIAAIFFGVFFGVGIVIGVTITITIFCYKDKKAPRRQDDGDSAEMKHMNPGQAQDQSNQRYNKSGPPPNKTGDKGVSLSPKNRSTGTRRAGEDKPDLKTNPLKPGEDQENNESEGPPADLSSDTENSEKDLLRVDIHSEKNGKGATEAASTQKQEVQGNPDDGSKEGEDRTRMQSLGIKRREVSEHAVLKETADQPNQDGASNEPTSLSTPVDQSSGTGSPAKQGVTMWTDIWNILYIDLAAEVRCNLASALLVDEDKIREIEENDSYSGQEKMNELLAYWRAQNPKASPDTLVAALRRCGCGELANRVDECWQTRYDRRLVC